MISPAVIQQNLPLNKANWVLKPYKVQKDVITGQCIISVFLSVLSFSFQPGLYRSQSYNSMGQGMELQREVHLLSYTVAAVFHTVEF